MASLPALLAAAVATLASAQVIVNTTVEYVPAPLAVDITWTPKPGFSWALDPSSGQCGSPCATLSYQLVVWSGSPSGPVVWDSGVVSGAPSGPVYYAGQALAFEMDYFWNVAVTTVDGGTFSSDVTMFSTAPDPVAWAKAAVWVGGANQLRYNFTLSTDAVTRARVFASSVGIFALYINGQRVGGGLDVLTPGWSTVPTVRQLAFGWDVASLLRPGENVIGVRLGMGKYGYMGVFCTAGPQACQASVVRLSISQGASVTVIETSPAWTATQSPITFDHLFDGETYNATMEQRGWNAPGFIPTAPWSPASIIQPNVSALSGWDTGIRVIEDRPAANVTTGPGQPVYAGGQFVKSASSVDIWWVTNGSTVRNHVDECTPCGGINACNLFVIVPQSYIDGLQIGANFTCAQLPNGTASYVFDFTRNMAGFCTLTLPAAPAGTTVSLIHGEILTVAGAVDNTFGTSTPVRSCDPTMYNCADQLDIYVMSGLGNEVYTPTFTFHGFRYVALFGWPASAPAPTTSTLTCHVTSSNVATSAGITTNSSALNSVQDAIVATQRSNMFSHPSDCPQREKRGWMGDAQVSSDEALYNFAAAPLYVNWLRSFLDTQTVGCSNPGADAAIAADGSPQQPPTYVCCGNQASFGCQPGLTPLNATGSLPDVVPYEKKPLGAWPGDWTWQVAGEVIPRAVLEVTGDTAAVQRVYPMIQAHLAFAAEATANTSHGLINYGYYGDWLSTETTSTTFIENFYYVQGLLQAAQVASAIGASGDAVAYTALATTIEDAMVDTLFDAAKGMWDSGSMNAQAMALVAQLGGNRTANATASIIAALVADAASHGFHPTCGLGSCRYILQGLTLANGSAGLAMATVPDSPSWTYMASAGMPGTIWESWGGDAHTSDGSKNHPMFAGGIGVWLHEDAVGLRVRFHAAPSPPTVRLDDACARELAALSVDVQRALGFTAEEAVMLCTVLPTVRKLKAGRPGGLLLWEVQQAVADVAQGAGLPQVTRPRAMQRHAVLAPSADTVRGLGSASGWMQTMQGRVEASWSMQPGATTHLSARIAVPSGVSTAHVAVPLDLIDGEKQFVRVTSASLRTPLVAQLERAAGSSDWQLLASDALPLGVTAHVTTRGHVLRAQGHASAPALTERVLHVQLTLPGDFHIEAAVE